MTLPDNIDMKLEWNNYDCKYDANSDIHFNCNGEKAMLDLANQNQCPEFSELAKACYESSSLVDFDMRHHQLVFHD